MQGLIGTPWQGFVRRPAMIRVRPRESGSDDCQAQIGFAPTPLYAPWEGAEAVGFV